MPFYADLHVHSVDFSGDATDTMEEMCKSATKRGLKMICFTDHVDFSPHYDDSIPFDPKRYDAAIEQMRERYGHRLRILKGWKSANPTVIRGNMKGYCGTIMIW